MSDSSSPLGMLGIAASPVIFLGDSAESRNCLVLGPTQKAASPGPDVPAFDRNATGDFKANLPIHEDVTMAFLAGGLPGADPSLRPRAVAVAGPGCTLVGIARSLLRFFNAAAPRVTAGGPLTEGELARALLAYNKDFLGYSGPLPVPYRSLPIWNVGTYLTLPLELDTTAQVWITNFEKIRTWAGTLTTFDDQALGETPAPLSLPDPDALAVEVTALLAAHPNIVSLATADDLPPGTGTGLRRQVLTNPFEVVFRIVEVMRQLRAAGPGGTSARRADIITMIVALCESVSIQVLQPVAQSMGGNAILRQFQIALEDPGLVVLANPDATKLQRTRTVLAGVLGLVPNGTDWQKVREWGPTVVPQELPLTSTQQVRQQGSSHFLQGNVFGRTIDISVPDKQGGWATLSFAFGKNPPVSWLSAHGSDADIDRAITPAVPAPPHDPAKPTFPALLIERDKVRARVQVAARIAGSEGSMDSCQAGDFGLVSFGFQQWAAHNEEELTVLLERYRAQAPDHFDLFFGMLGLGTKRWVGNLAPVTNSNPVPDPPPNDVDDANPYGPDPSTLGDPFDPADQPRLFDYFPFFVTFVEVTPGKAAANDPAGKFASGLGARFAFLMKDGRFRIWCGRARMAGLLSRAYLRAQVEQAVFRFTRIENEKAASNFQPYPSAPFAVPSAEPTTTLSAGIASGDTTAKVADGAIFPRSGSFLLLCEQELLLCTKRVNQTLTIQRGQEGTAAAVHASGSVLGRAFGFAALSAGIDAVATDISVKTGGLYIAGTQGIRLACGEERMLCTARTPGTLTVQRGYEGTVATTHAADAILYRVDGDTVLSAAMGANDTSIAVNDGSFLPAAGNVLLRCGSEIMLCTASAANTLTVVRGQEGTTKSAHAAGATLYRVAGYAELFNAEFAAGAMLDLHINQPSNAIAKVFEAIRRTPGDTHAADGSLDQIWLRRFGVNFLAARAPLQNMRDRNHVVLQLHDQRPAVLGGTELGLSPDPGSFTWWKRSTP